MEEGVASDLMYTSRQFGVLVGLALAVSALGAFTYGKGVADGGRLAETFTRALLGTGGFALLAILAPVLLSGRPRPNAPQEIAIMSEA